MFNSRLSMVFALGLLPLVLLGADTREFRDLSPAEQVEVMRSEARVALVIGNGSYDTAPLANPASDARAVAKALRAVGFSVTFEKDLGNLEMKRALSEFGRTLEAGGVGLFYYAGHGIQHDGTNYLVPVDAELKRPDDLEIYGVQADAVLAKMENAGNRVNIVILDACRNDPFSRSSGGGLAMMDARGTFLAYASGAGRVATDEGVYAKALVVDDAFALVGTANLDVRSLRLNYETNLVVYDDTFVNQMKEIVLDDEAHSRALQLEAWRRRPLRQRCLENLAHLMKPVL